jgi:hypothetical protein
MTAKAKTSVPPVAQPLPATRRIRIGGRSVMTSLGPSHDATGRRTMPVHWDLPREEADNLVSLGYAAYVE